MTTRVLCTLAFALAGLLLADPAFGEGRGPDRQDFEAAVEQVGQATACPTALSAMNRRPAPPRRRGVRFLVAPYGWLASVEGTAVSGGKGTELDIPFSDISERVNGGFQLYTEARWRGWFLAFDGTWAKLGDEVDLTLAQLDIDITQRIFDVRVGREFFRRSRDGALDPCCEPYRRWIVADAYLGARYWYTKVKLQTTGPLGRPRETSGVDERWDPFIGTRFGFDITRRWGVGVRADVGGFGIGDAARLTWQVSGFMSYDVTRWLHLILGWRAIYADTVEGSGPNRNGSSLLQQGPIIGGGFSF